jgi:beta-glucuronidase
MAASDDPFHHLHDEGYAGAYVEPRATAVTLVGVLGRATESLDGAWRFTPDLFDEGLRQKWFALDAVPPSQWAAPRDYEIAAGELVPVPSCWNLFKPEWMHFEGAGWYTRDFRWTPSHPGERLVLHVGAANYATCVFLNGVFLGSHRGGSTPFCVELTVAVQDGDNRLQIMVENRRRPDRVPMHHIDWFNYGGLYREVQLLRLSAVYIMALDVALSRDGAAIELAVHLSDPVCGVVKTDIAELGISVDIVVQDGVGRIAIAAQPERWSPQCPRLYEVVATFGHDRVTDRVGFRTIAVDGVGLRLNGRPIRLKGVCVHEDDLAAGKASSEDDVRRRFRHARELGCNFLRLAHYPHHEHVARIADEEGLLLWAEIPVYWAIDFANPATYADAENQLLELIRRDMNRASVIIWGVGNENADTDDRLGFMAGLARATRQADPTRLVGAACLINRAAFAIEDRLADYLDVIGLNEYFGWYEPDFSGLDRLLANSRPGKPVIVSETGADALPGHHGAGRVLFSEDWQAHFIAEQLARLAPVGYIAGVALWLLYDFRSERRQTSFQRGFNRKGLIDETKTNKKLAFEAVRRAFETF